jgi:AAA+ superfamily predicted ATPase
VEWSSDTLKSLVVPDHTKQTLRDLIRSYLFEKARNKDAFHQMLGKGLNIALHSPPGVGKPLTCEVVAEELRRPLYVVSVSKISDNAKSVQQQLREVFKIADA